jgi:uncharacterized membrane protein YqjE
MDPDDELREDLPEPGWKERIGAVRRAASALFATRAEIFREELAEKGSVLARAAAGLVLASVFGFFALVLLTALVAAVFSRLFGGPIAGIAAALFLYLAVAVVAAVLGGKALSRVKPFAFPATRDEIRKDLDAVTEHGTVRDEAATDAVGGADAIAAERASLRPENRQRYGEEVREAEAESGNAGARGVASMSELEDRFRAGSE